MLARRLLNLIVWFRVPYTNENADMRTILKTTLTGILLFSAWLAVASGARAQQPAGAPAPAKPSAGLTDRPDDEKAIRLVGETFRKAFAAGDAKAVAALFTEDAEIVDETFDRIQGRSEIQDAYSSLFQGRKGTTIEILVDSIRFLAPDVAKEEGRTRVKEADSSEPPTVRRYTVLFVRQSGQWRYSSVREELEPALTHRERLQELAWMVGDWIDEGSDSVVHAICKWSPCQNFLLRDFTIESQGKPVMTVHQRIGWDPLSKQIKSWVFDSEGGYGSASWTRVGNQWMIKSTGILRDGRIATATNILTRTGPNAARWSSTERTIGGVHAPDRSENVFVRNPPGPQPEPSK